MENAKEKAKDQAGTTRLYNSPDATDNPSQSCRSPLSKPKWDLDAVDNESHGIRASCDFVMINGVVRRPISFILPTDEVNSPSSAYN